MQINVALQDGFDSDDVVIRVDGVEAYRGEQVTRGSSRLRPLSAGF